jgi:tRNA A-37 threonylcarbamoyl transferase component Bud32
VQELIQYPMADLQIAVKYLPIQQKIGFWVMCVLAPGWALLIPACLGAFISYVFVTPSVADSLACVVVLLSLIGLMIAGVVFTAFFEDDTVYATKSGLAFPLAFLLNTKFKRHKEWDELVTAEILSSDTANQKLLLIFKLGAKVILEQKNVSHAELEKLLLAIELWGTNCTRSPSLIEFQRGLNSDKVKTDGGGYTQMWEEELGRRFSTTNFMPLEPDQKLRDGRIKIVRQLAFGGLSAIYLAQTRDSEMVVIKEAVLPATVDEDTIKSAQERLQREFHTLSHLKHPNITGVRDYFVENGRNYLMLDYVIGQDLRQLVKQNGPQPEQDVIRWGVVLASVLNYLHTQSTPILHRDFTPDNVVRKNDGELTVIDFGAANEFIGSATGTLIGKQAYIAPEQLRGKAVPGSDIYALGGSLFYLLTGRDPKPLAVARPKNVVPDISVELDNLVAKCTEFEAENRYACAEDLQMGLMALLKREGAVLEG